MNFWKAELEVLDMVELSFLGLVKKCISSSPNLAVEELCVTYFSHQGGHCTL